MTSASRQFCILVVDDDAAVALSVRRAFRRRGDQVLTAQSVAEAWLLLQERPERPIDHALIDLTLPDGDGLTLAVDLHTAYPHIRITLTTGGSAPVSTDFGLLPKPFTVNELWAAVPNE